MLNFSLFNTVRPPPTNFSNLDARCKRIAAAFGFSMADVRIQAYPPSHNPDDLALRLSTKLYNVEGVEAVLGRPPWSWLDTDDIVTISSERAVNLVCLFRVAWETQFSLHIHRTPYFLSWSSTRGLDPLEREPLLAPTMIRGLYCLGYGSGVEELCDYFNDTLTDGGMAALALRMHRAGFSIPEHD